MLDLEVLRLTWGCYAWPGGAMLDLGVLCLTWRCYA
jgi:hypothetical protein